MDYKTNTVDVLHDNVHDAVDGRTGSKCGPCERRKRSSRADQYCQSCSEFLCNNCCEAHKIYKPGDHDIRLASEAVSEKKYVDMKGFDCCLEHKKAFVFFCKDHDELCCEIYALAHHRKCDNLHEIAKVVENYNLDDGNLTQEVISAINKATTCIEKSTHALTKTKTQMSEICQQIDACKDKAMRAFDRSKEQVIKDMTETIEKEKTRQESRQLAANKARDSIDTTKSIFQAVNKDGSVTERFIVKQVLQKRLQEAKATFATLYLIDYSVDLNLHWKDNYIHQLFTCSDDICYVGVKRDNKSTNDLLIRKKCISAPVQFELMQTVNLVKTGNDKKEPLITGLDFLPDGRIIALDDYNCKCFVLSDTLKRADTYYTFQTHPRDVTCYSTNDIAVTVSFRDVRTICMLTVGSDNTITLIKTLSTSTKCFSICPQNDCTFLVSTWNDPRLARMIDEDGRESDFNNVLFPRTNYQFDDSRCSYIPSRHTLVMTDKYAQTIYLFNTLTGTSIEVKDARIQIPRGVCVGPDDSVFVCGKNSIVQISPQGDILASCDVDMNGLYALAVSSDGLRLVVTNSDIGGNKLKLLKLSCKEDCHERKGEHF